MFQTSPVSGVQKIRELRHRKLQVTLFQTSPVSGMQKIRKLRHRKLQVSINEDWSTQTQRRSLSEVNMGETLFTVIAIFFLHDELATRSTENVLLLMMSP